MDGLRGEIPISELCRRERIAPTMYYRWSKAFLDAGKNGLTRETLRDATTEEVRRLKEGNASLKKAVAEAILDLMRYKKPRDVDRRRYVRMSANRKLEVLRAVEGSVGGVAEALARLEISPSTYYRWRQWFRTGGVQDLADRNPLRDRNWNQLLPDERAKVLSVALLYPEWSSREIACHMEDNCGFTVSESTVYRSPRQAGRIKPKEARTFPTSTASVSAMTSFYVIAHKHGPAHRQNTAKSTCPAIAH
jgi:transposase-like protein